MKYEIAYSFMGDMVRLHRHHVAPNTYASHSPAATGV